MQLVQLVQQVQMVQEAPMEQLAQLEFKALQAQLEFKVQLD